MSWKVLPTIIHQPCEHGIQIVFINNKAGLHNKSKSTHNHNINAKTNWQKLLFNKVQWDKEVVYCSSAVLQWCRGIKKNNCSPDVKKPRPQQISHHFDFYSFFSKTKRIIFTIRESHLINILTYLIMRYIFSKECASDLAFFTADFWTYHSLKSTDENNKINDG